MRYEFDYEKIGTKFYPMIPILLGRGNSWVPVSALLDSGATISILNGDVGRALDINIENGERIEPLGIGGKIIAFIHKIKLKINGSVIEAEVAFTDELSVPLNLLGRKGIFESFLVCFNDREKKVILEG